MHVGLRDHGEEGPVDPAPALEEGGVEDSLSELGDAQLEVAGLRRDHPRAVPVALGHPRLGALEGPSPDLLGRLGLDQGQVDQLGALADGVDVAAGADHLEELEDVRLVQDHWVLPFDV